MLWRDVRQHARIFLYLELGMEGPNGSDASGASCSSGCESQRPNGAVHLTVPLTGKNIGAFQ